MSRLFRRYLSHRLLDAAPLRDTVLFVGIIQTDSRDVLAKKARGTHEKIVEVLFDHPPQQMLAKVRDFRVLIDNQDATSLENTSANGFPIVRKNAAQIDHLETKSVLFLKLIGPFHAQG